MPRKLQPIPWTWTDSLCTLCLIVACATFAWAILSVIPEEIYVWTHPMDSVDPNFFTPVYTF
jgi:hypothetical protein